MEDRFAYAETWVGSNRSREFQKTSQVTIECIYGGIGDELILIIDVGDDNNNSLLLQHVGRRRSVSEKVRSVCCAVFCFGYHKRHKLT